MLRKHSSTEWVAVAFGFLTLANFAIAETTHWDRFRGPNGSGVSLDPSPPPTTWSPDKNIRWQIELPGPGSSSPIIVGDKIFVTCWTGYGTPEASNSSVESMRRHLICIERSTGKTLWNQSVEPALPEDSYQGMFAEHGYASHTPTSDGERVYVFFGKTGVIAFDMQGKELWRQDVGDGLDSRRWGSSSSPILYKDLVIVTASAEKKAIVALDKLTGKVVWQQKADGLESVWGTPILVKVDDARTDLVIGVPFELWGFDPANGELRWYCPGLDTDTFCSSVVSDNSIVYAIEGRSGGSIAVKAGGKDDISKTNVVWSGRDRSRIGTPVLYQEKLYYFSGGIANCIDAKTGKQVFQSRLQRDLASGQPNESAAPADSGEPRRRGGGGGGGGQDYSSPIVAGGMIYYTSRSGDVFVIQPGDELKQIAVNRVSNDRDEDFSSTPAASDGQLYIRSSKRLYCVAN